MEIKYTCPLGSECEEAKDGVLYRCRWFVKLRGTDPQSGEPMDEFRCSHEWGIVMSVENTQQVRQLGAAVESLRNEFVKGQAQATAQLVQFNQKHLGKS